MVFSSVLFLFRFLPIFMICYFLVPRNMKNLVLFLEPGLLCLGRAGLYFSDAFFHDFGFRMGKADRGI